MLHETLLALVGCPGSIITDRGAAGFAVADDVTFLSSAEKQAVDKVVWLGHRFRELSRFVQHHTGASQNAVPRSGLYLRALCTGIEEVLTRYTERVSELEQQVLDDPGLPLSHVHCAMRDYARTLPAIHELIVTVERRSLSGGQILEELHRRSHSGFPLVRSCMLRLQRLCLSVLYNHMSAWVSHGILSDQYGEFFIKHDDLEPSVTEQRGTDGAHRFNASAMGSVGSGLRAGLHHLTAHRHLLVGDRATPLMLDPHLQHSGSISAVELGQHPEPDAVEAELEWHTQFTLRLHMLPSLFFPVRLAETVLFIGRAVQVLRKCDRLAEADGTRPPLLTADDVQEFGTAIETLKRAREWRLLDVQCALERMRGTVAQRLHELVVKHGRLMEHLSALKDYLLLAKGEFFQAFIDESVSLFAKGPSAARATLDINAGPFTAAARTLALESDPHWRRLKLHLHLPRFDFRQFGPAAEHGLRFVGTAAHVAEHSIVTLAAPPPAALPAPSTTTEIVEQANVPQAMQSSTVSSMSTGARAQLGSNWPGGAVWCTDPKEVSRSFTIALEFQFNADQSGGVDGNPATGFAIVLQAQAAGALGRGGSGLGYDGIPNSIAIEIDIACAPDCHEFTNEERRACCCRPPLGPHVAVHTCGSAPNSAGHRAALGVAPLPSQSLPSGRTSRSSLQPEPATAGSSSVADNVTHHLRVDYEPLPARSVSAGLQYGFRVFLDDPDARRDPLLEVPINVAKTLSLERTGGRAWIGVTASVAGVSDVEEARLAGGVPHLKSWSFRGGGAGAEAGERTPELAVEEWHGLELRYNVEWPLHLVVTQEALRRYNRMFAFLFMLKRAAVALQRAWALLMAPHYRTCARGDIRGMGGASHMRQSGYGVLMRLWTLRARMAFLIGNLQYFAQVETIDVQFHKLRKNIEAATDFETVRKAHDVYLSALSQHTYLHVASIRDAVKRIMKSCLSFVALLEEAPDQLANVDVAKVVAISSQFDKDAKFLFHILQSSNAQDLILRLNFNHYFV